MGWQEEVREILEAATWPPRTAGLRRSPWAKLVALALLGWALVELLRRLRAGARATGVARAFVQRL